MKLKKIVVLFVALALLIGGIGCNTDSADTISKPPVPMKENTNISLNFLVTVTCDLPEDWVLIPVDYFSFVGISEFNNKNKQFETEIEKPPYLLRISSYERSGGAGGKNPDGIIQRYPELFADKPEQYKKLLDNEIFIKYFMDEESKEEYIKDFQYQHYDGKHGKITEVQYSFEYKGKTYRYVNCIRQDIPYVVSGAFDDSLELSSGDIALWVANSLEVLEEIPDETLEAETQGAVKGYNSKYLY